MIVLGLDVSSTRTGWAVLKHGRFYKRKRIDYGMITPPKNLGPAEKLAFFRTELGGVLEGMPDKVVIGLEDTFFFRNPKTLKVLSRFAGVALLSCWEVCEVEPVVVPVKALRTIWGTQDKKEIFKLVTDKYNLHDWQYSKHNDVTDAVAIAFYLHKTL